MSLSRSLNTGASSVRAHQQRMDVVSNNIANVNTIGYKSSRANFADQFSQIMTYGTSPKEIGNRGFGGQNPKQIGLGVKMASITADMSQGALEMTNRPLDMAIQGDGMFVYNFNGNTLFSRAGAVIRDSSGFLVDSGTGAFLQGYNVETDVNGRIIRDGNGEISLEPTYSNLNIPPGIKSAPKQTEKVSFTGNLSADAETSKVRETSILIFDNEGRTHTLTFTFSKDAIPNSYTASAKIDGNALTLPNSTITFNTDGTLSSPMNFQLNASDLNTALGNLPYFDATTPKNLTVTLAETNDLTGGLTQYAGNSSATASFQDGFEPGELISLGVEQDGTIKGAFSNGQNEKLGQVILAKFTNAQGLTKEGNNFYSTSPNSGNPVFGTTNDIAPSTLISGGSLEGSNTDLTEEFVNMITTQRGFEAASRTITVSDQMLAEINNLKR